MRRPGAPSRQAASPAPFYMLGEMGIPFLLIKKKKPLFIFACAGSSLLHLGFLQLQQAGGFFRCSVQGFSLRWLLVVEHSL